MTKERIILDKFRTMLYDDGLPKYRVARTDRDGRLATEDTYTDDKVGIFHVLMHVTLNHYTNPPKIMEAQPIGVCFRRKTANRKLHEAAYRRGMELQELKQGLLETRTDGDLKGCTLI